MMKATLLNPLKRFIATIHNKAIVNVSTILSKIWLFGKKSNGLIEASISRTAYSMEIIISRISIILKGYLK